MNKHALEYTSHCKVTGLPITKRPHWNTYHSEAGYNASFAAIGPDIVYIQAITDNDTCLDYMDIQLFRTVCDDLGITGRNVFVIFNFEHIRNILYAYKKDFARLVYNWGPIFSVLMIYNVHPDVRTVVESLSSICPENALMLVCDSYEEAILRIMYYKSRNGDEKLQGEDDCSNYNANKKSFLSALAGLCWLDMQDLPINVPKACGEFEPLFLALEEFRKDMVAKTQEHRKDISQTQQRGEQQLEQNRIQLNAKLDLYMKNAVRFRHEITEITNNFLAKEVELAQITALAENDGSRLSRMYEQISGLVIEPELKTRLLNECRALIETDAAVQLFRMELTEADRQFLQILQQKHPELPEKERRLCLLIKLNYSTKDITRQTGISIRGIETIRYRLHRKLGLKKHQSMKQYFTWLQAET